jgi:hypothetical protein
VISFRYHVVSLVAVLLALAAGIAVGSGPLQRSAADNEGGQERALRLARQQATEAEQELAFGDAYADATADRVVAGRLEGRAVTMVGLPGADEESVATVTDLVGRSGGAVTARVTVSEELLDVGNRQLVAELAAQMQREAADEVRVPEQADGYERMAQLLAHAVATTETAGAPVDDVGEGVLAGLSTAELAVTEGEIDRRGSLVVVVTGEPYGSADTQEGAGSILSTLVTAIDARSGGVVVAGPHTHREPAESAAAAVADEDNGVSGGLVAAVRADPTAARAVSTVDVVDRAAGAVATVLAAAAESGGRAGHYGTAESPDGPVPGAANAG